jgi:hypothetical protein
MKKVEIQTNFSFIDDLEFRNKLSILVDISKERRRETQKDISNILEIPLTKIKQIESGTCVDFNAINNYINYFGCGFI